MDEEKLSLCSTDDLLAELYRRFDAVLFCGYSDVDQKRYHYRTQWKGCDPLVRGMADYAIQRIDIAFHDPARLASGD